MAGEPTESTQTAGLEPARQVVARLTNRGVLEGRSDDTSGGTEGGGSPTNGSVNGPGTDRVRDEIERDPPPQLGVAVLGT